MHTRNIAANSMDLGVLFSTPLGYVQMTVVMDDYRNRWTNTMIFKHSFGRILAIPSTGSVCNAVYHKALSRFLNAEK